MWVVDKKLYNPVEKIVDQSSPQFCNILSGFMRGCYPRR